MRLGVLATRNSYRHHLRPIWEALEPEELGVWAERSQETRRVDVDLWLTASESDFQLTLQLPVPHVLMEHGTGLEWYRPAVLRRLCRANLIAAPNEYVARRYREFAPRRRVEVIGTPKMDRLLELSGKSRKSGTVALSLHWADVGNSIETWREAFGRLDVPIIGHGHPKAFKRISRLYADVGIEAVETFDEVVERADVYACDHSSTLFEWAALGRPVVLLERRFTGRIGDSPASGLRYGDYGGIGPQATPASLNEVLDEVLATGDPEHDQARREATAALYPHLGHSTELAVALLRDVAPHRALGRQEHGDR